jgi:F-type H+-transporting ATPase subunit epsilon
MADVFPTKLQLTVVTLDRKVLEVEADEVMLPAINGYIGVLPGHTPLLTILKVGEAMYRVGGRAHHFVVKSGFAEVLPDRVIAMVDSATMPGEVDRARAEARRAEAERELAMMASYDERFDGLQAQLDEANAQLQLAAHGE